MLAAGGEEDEDARSDEEAVEVASDAGRGLATPAKTVGRLRRGGVAGEDGGAAGRRPVTEPSGGGRRQATGRREWHRGEALDPIWIGRAGEREIGGGGFVRLWARVSVGVGVKGVRGPAGLVG